MTAIYERFDPRRLLPVVNGLLIAISAVLAVRAGIILVDGVDVEFESLELGENRSMSAPVPSTDWRMFGEPVEPDYGFDRPLPPTPLSLRLRGVVTGDRGYAIIVDAAGDEGVYRVGDVVPGEAEVVTIQPRRVVLERDGAREALELPGADAAVSRASRTEPATRPDDGLASGVGIGSLASMTSQFGLDPEALANRITILPVAGGGFRVRAGRDAAIFTRLGFHANDVVLAINGRPVDNRADVEAVFRDFRPDRPLAITVRRGDRQLVLTPDLSNLGGARSR